VKILKLRRTAGKDDCRRIYSSDDGRFTVEVSTISHRHGAGSLMDLWHRSGRIGEWMPQTLHVSTNYADGHGNTWGWFNPTIKEAEDGERNEIDFRWVLAATEENEALLLEECERRYLNDIRM